MKIQDIIFLVILLILIFKKDPKWFSLAGIISLFLSIPLFSLWIFFTAERLTWYGSAFFLLASIFYFLKAQNE